jgi:hypothetical protein
MILGGCMLRRFVLIFFALSIVAPARAAQHKIASKKEKEADSELSSVLAKPVAAALDSLQALNEAVQRARPKHPAAAIRRVDAVKTDLKEALGQVREAKVDKDEAAAKDAALVAVAAALRAADMASQGLQEGDDDQVQASLKLGALAQADLKRLDDEGDAPPAVGGGTGAAYKIGPSLGGDVSLVGQGNSSNMSADLSVSFPVSQAMDLGVGGSLSGNSSSSATSSSTSSGLGYGVNGFARYHFLQIFANAPWIVPYVGLKLSLSLNSSFSDSGASVTETDSTTTALGEQLGLLFFMSAKSAITVQLENDVNSSASNGTSSPSTDSLTLSMGARQMF